MIRKTYRLEYKEPSGEKIEKIFKTLQKALARAKELESTEGSSEITVTTFFHFEEKQ